MNNGEFSLEADLRGVHFEYYVFNRPLFKGRRITMAMAKAKKARAKRGSKQQEPAKAKAVEQPEPTPTPELGVVDPNDPSRRLESGKPVVEN